MISDLINRLKRVKANGLADDIRYECMDLCDAIDDAIRDRMSHSKRPTSDVNHVGVEIEFISKSLDYEIFDDIMNEGLADKVAISDDCSINADYPEYGHEIKVIDTEKNIKSTIERVCKIINKHSGRVNDSCGLHVHIDCRNRDRNFVFTNFFKAQDLLYRLVNPNRSDNGYSDRNYDIDLGGGGHYYGVERSCLGTVEIRMHHGTTGANDINNWLELLLRIANKRAIYSGESHVEVIKETRFKNETKEFINERITFYNAG